MNKIAPAQISIVIPVGPQEVQHLSLLQDLARDDWLEIIICCPQASLAFHQDLLETEANGLSEKVKLLATPRPGRAEQLNFGAIQAHGRFLWFVHADSRIPNQSVRKFLKKLAENPCGLFYFDLLFRSEFRWAMKINEIGVWWRSHFLGMPFGDQALCISKDSFLLLGSFDSKALYGEDHLFVWHAKRRGIALIGVGSKISTSARKYEAIGWKAMTGRHLRMTYSQAWPQFLAWLNGR